VRRFVLVAAAFLASCAGPRQPYVVVLGVAQDGGAPQAGTFSSGPRHSVVCLGLVDPASGQRWMFDATPDFPAQLRALALADPARRAAPGVDGIFLTHAHVGHYTGLMFLGHEVMGARAVPVYAMPRMREFLGANGPWSQLVRLRNIDPRPLEAGVPVPLSDRLTVTPILVPHRQEFSEVVGFRIEGPGRAVLFIPDIDSWTEWDEQGVRVEDEIARVDAAYLDGTFYADGEIPGRDMRGFPHPFITASMQRFAALPAAERRKIRFIHLNHTNPALDPGSGARRDIRRNGFGVARQGERIRL
jgi:pyrroloquinoline quinone biosynthesis protein B